MRVLPARVKIRCNSDELVVASISYSFFAPWLILIPSSFTSMLKKYDVPDEIHPQIKKFANV
jgi:hypothetical protein